MNRRIRILPRRRAQPTLPRIPQYVLAERYVVVQITDTPIVIARLPNIVCVAKFLAPPVRVATLDQLYGLLQGRVGRGRYKCVKVVGHDDELMQPILALGSV